MNQPCQILIALNLWLAVIPLGAEEQDASSIIAEETTSEVVDNVNVDDINTPVSAEVRETEVLDSEPAQMEESIVAETKTSTPEEIDTPAFFEFFSWFKKKPKTDHQNDTLESTSTESLTATEVTPDESESDENLEPPETENNMVDTASPTVSVAPEETETTEALKAMDSELQSVESKRDEPKSVDTSAAPHSLATAWRKQLFGDIATTLSNENKPKEPAEDPWKDYVEDLPGTVVPARSSPELRNLETNPFVGMFAWLRPHDETAKRKAEKAIVEIDTDVPHDQVDTNVFGVVADVEGQEKGPFEIPGRYELKNKNTGLLQPIGLNDRISTLDHRIQLILKEPVLLSLDQNTSLQLDKTIEIHEMLITKGRVRVQLHKGAGLWTLRGRDVSFAMNEMSDVIIDMTGALITRIFVIQGGGFCMPYSGQEPVELSAGDHISVGLSDTIRSTPSEDTWTFLKSHLSFKDINTFGQKVAAAKSFSTRGSFEWPVTDKTFSGLLCTHCGYGFDIKEEPYSFCPQCHEALSEPVRKAQLPKDKEASSWFVGGSRSK